MAKRLSLALAVALLAIAHTATADIGNLFHKKKALKVPQVEVSGPRETVAVSGVRTVGVSGAASILPDHVTKADRVKALLGVGGINTVAATVPPGCRSAYSFVRGNANFTFLDAALKSTGLVSVLDDPALIATVFAPTDAAFTATLADLKVTPQELFDDTATLTVLLKYHVLPGISLEKNEFRDAQLYDTLLTDKKKNKYTVEFNADKEVDLKALKLTGDLSSASTTVYEIIPSGGDAAGILSFNLQPGCPTSVNVIDYVLIPDYKDALLVDAIDTAVDAAQTYTDAGVTLGGRL